MRSWKWQDELYGATFHLVEGTPADFGRYMKTAFARDVATDGAAHTLLMPVDFTIVIWLQAMPASALHLSVVAHEAFHATTFVMEHVGITLRDESDEAFAYYLGWLVRNLVMRLTKRAKPKRKAA